MERIEGKGSAKFLPVVHAKPRALGYRAVQVLAFVREFIEANGRPPSYGIICDSLGFNDKGDVAKCVARLEKRGTLIRMFGDRHGENRYKPVITLVHTHPQAKSNEA